MTQDHAIRIDNMIRLYEEVFKTIADPQTLIKGTTIEKLCEYNAGGYQRVIRWLQEQIKIKVPQPNTPDMDLAKKLFDECLALMTERNAKYGDSFKQLRLSSIIDLMIMKLDRCQKQELNNEAIKAELLDVVNYSIFGLMKIEKK